MARVGYGAVIPRFLAVATILVSVFSTPFPSHAADPVHNWSQRFGSVANDFSSVVAMDASGDVIVTGEFSGTVDFGGGPLTSAGDWDIFIAKYDANGSHQWSRRLGDFGWDRSAGIATDASGSVLVTGGFVGTVDFGGGPLTSRFFSTDIFVVKYDANGNHQWSRHFGDTGFDSGLSVAVDPSGHVILTGKFQGTVDFGGGALTSAGPEDIFVARYDADGNHQWSRRFGETGYDAGLGVTADASGNVIVTGYYMGPVDFGGGPLPSSNEDIFVAKYDSNGAHLWSRSRTGGGAANDRGLAVAIDVAGNVIATGYFAFSVNFGGGTLTSAGLSDIFVVKYDESGSHVWSQRFGGAGDDAGRSVAVDSSGNIVVTGDFEETVAFGGGPLISAGDHDIFAACYDANGSHQWSQRFGDTGRDEGGGAAADASGNVALTGDFVGTADFGGGPLTSAGASDIFVATFDNGLVPVLITSFTATSQPSAVELLWDIWSDEALIGFIVYRREADQEQANLITTGRLDAATRSYIDRDVESEKTYHYVLVVEMIEGTEFRSQTATVWVPPIESVLDQNFPNPFNPATTIRYTLDKSQRVTISIHDTQGKLVRRLVDDVQSAGGHVVDWKGLDDRGTPVSSGVYFYVMKAGKDTQSKRMVLLK